MWGTYGKVHVSILVRGKPITSSQVRVMVLLPGLLVEDMEGARENRERVASGFGNATYDQDGVGTSITPSGVKPYRWQAEAVDGGMGGWQSEYDVDADYVSRRCGNEFTHTFKEAVPHRRRRSLWHGNTLDYEEEDALDGMPKLMLSGWPSRLQDVGERHLTTINGESVVRTWK